jgi:hypothetical protein
VRKTEDHVKDKEPIALLPGPPGVSGVGCKCLALFARRRASVYSLSKSGDHGLFLSTELGEYPGV